ncbi:MAG TPA: hypothetical protein VMF11_12540 [Candidatus Baltobacteraceae bacterium]|nr:hypothetical protein [Candidatus Baltobacteraceae bacterium]
MSPDCSRELEAVNSRFTKFVAADPRCRLAFRLARGAFVDFSLLAAIAAVISVRRRPIIVMSLSNHDAIERPAYLHPA